MRWMRLPRGRYWHRRPNGVSISNIIIGSFHFDPRSAELNTELGFVIDSSSLAEQIKEALDARISANAYEVRLSDAGKLYWIEPGTGSWCAITASPA
jgi:cardiolipin synthase C